MDDHHLTICLQTMGPVRGAPWQLIRILALGVALLAFAGFAAEFVSNIAHLGHMLYVAAGLGFLVMIALTHQRFFVTRMPCEK